MSYIALLLIAFVILGVVYSTVTPLYEASDELSHYPFVHHLAQGGGLPVQDPQHPGSWLQEGSQPPLYYALAALVSACVPSDDLEIVLPLNPHADSGVARPDGNANLAIHSSRDAFPYRGAALAIHLVRWLSVALGAVTVLATYCIGLEILPRQHLVALAGAGIVAFTPMFLFISGSVNNDNLVIALSSLAVWQMLRLLRLPPTHLRWVLLGGTIGLAALAKVSGLTLLPLAAITVAWLAWRHRDVRLLLWGGLAVTGGVVLLAGWWYVRNWQLYGDLFGFNAFVAIVGPRPAGFGLRELASEWSSFVKSYWGVFGGMNVVAPAWFYGFFSAIALGAFVGLVLHVVRRFRMHVWPSLDAYFRLGLLALWPLIVLVGVVRWSLLTPASQGRLLFPAIAGLSLLLALGLMGWLPGDGGRQASNVKRQTSGTSSSHLTFDVSRLARYIICLAPVVLMAGLAAWVPFGVIAPAYTPPPFLTESQVAAVPNRLNCSFAGQMELLGYDLPARVVQPGEWVEVTLYWRANAPMDEDYSVFVHLLDRWQVVVAQRDRYPGRGLLPTSQWHPGDALADTYYLQIPSDLAKPMELQVRVGLYRLATGARLPVQDSQGQMMGDNVALGSLRVQPASCARIEHEVYYSLEDQIALIGYNLEPDRVRPGQVLHLTLFWRALAPPSGDYTVFTHLLAPGNVIIAQEDAPPWGGAAPTGSWQAGEVLCDTYALQVQAEVPVGDAELEVGMYRTGTLERLQILGPEGEVLGDRIVLARIHVQR